MFGEIGDDFVVCIVCGWYDWDWFFCDIDVEFEVVCMDCWEMFV